jgi:aldose 1-epimerase
MLSAAPYYAQRITVDGIEVIRLEDVGRKTVVSIVPSIGNTAYDMQVNGKAVFWSPYRSLAEFQAKPTFLGNPFLAPWANRLDQDGFWANGKRYALNGELRNFRRDPNQQPIHGLLAYSKLWKVTRLQAQDNGAQVTSRLEFWRSPDLMAQFPFAHTLEMTYRLRDGVLEVETVIENHSDQPMPVSIGYHPYFKIDDAPRDEWRVHLAAREHVKLTPKLVPSGEKATVALADPLPLAGHALDDVFTGLVRDAKGQAEFWVQGRQQKIAVVYGPKYHHAVVFAPKGRDFICFEPMSGPTNAFNLHHEGKYPELQTVAPGGVWRESFWIAPSGY